MTLQHKPKPNPRVMNHEYHPTCSIANKVIAMIWGGNLSVKQAVCFGDPAVKYCLAALCCPVYNEFLLSAHLLTSTKFQYIFILKTLIPYPP
jgi:hypothetical protein